MTLLYNIVMLAVDIAAIGLLRRYRGLLPWCGTLFCAGISAAVLGFMLGEDHFGVIRLWCYGLFLHGAVLLAATAVLWRRCHRLLAIGAALVLFALVAVAVDAFLVEPHWLEVSHRRFASRKIHKPVRIVVIADLQTDSIGPYERRVLQQVVDERPDVILFAGDYIQSFWEQQKALRDEFRGILSQWAAGGMSRKKFFAVRGNCDPDDWGRLFAGTGLAVTVVDATESFDVDDIRLTCLGARDSFSRSLAIADDMPDKYHVVLGHAPNFALGRIDADLLLAGHTHGGQVRLPWIGPLMTLSAVPRAWGAGLTELPDGSKLLVSRGIGMERLHAPRLRFLCRPELAVIDLVPEANSDE